ncbi:putative glucan endo-1,3-beta-glucosidase BG4 [Castanea sativa]|uniref:putative glucan endo-1,3-beta-glucosidase BG4 n=1 Tax=Castanea sativa TaxID=21020 RepID=UPI003F651168
MATFWIASILLAIAAINHNNNGIVQADILYAGIAYGTSGNNTPDAFEAVLVCHKYGIRRIRIMETDDLAIQSLRGTVGIIEATLGIKDEILPGLASSYEAVKSWFEINLQPYVPSEFVVNYIVVGNKAIPGPNAMHVLPIVKNLQQVLADNNLTQIKVATAVSTDVLRTVFPPSHAAFSEKAQGDLIPVLQHLQATDSPLFIDVYPYHYFAAGLIRQDFATFSTHKPQHWDKTLGYWSMYDVLVDAFIWAMEKLDLDVKMVIGETGWPAAGNGGLTTPEIARTYNQNFLRHITAGHGTPKRPYTYWEGFLYSMYNENGKPEGVDQRFGIFYNNREPVYHLYFPYPKKHGRKGKSEKLFNTTG